MGESANAAESRNSGGERGGFDRPRALSVLAGVVLVNVAGATPAILSGPDSAWFQALVKPAIHPPTWVFGVVWTLLFTVKLRLRRV